MYTVFTELFLLNFYHFISLFIHQKGVFLQHLNALWEENKH